MNIISPSPTLSGVHQRTYEKIFRKPDALDLPWRDILGLFLVLGDVALHPSGLCVTRNGHRFLCPSIQPRSAATADDLRQLRHFLNRSETPPTESQQIVPLLLVVIDQSEARLFRAELNHPQAPRLLRHAPSDFFHYHPDSAEPENRCNSSAPANFYQPVAEALQNASLILLYGTGRGTTSPELDQFITWLKQHHPDVVLRIIGTRVVGEYSLTEPFLLASARECYSSFPTR